MAGPLLAGVIIWKISWVRAGLPGPLHTSSKFQNASGRNGPAVHRVRGGHTHMGTRTRTRTHARMSYTGTVTGRESPSLPLHQDCLFHLGGLAARQHLELRRVLGGRGDLGDPGRRRAIERRGNTNVYQNSNQPPWPGLHEPVPLTI